MRCCFSAIDFFERRRIPFVIGVNCFGGVQLYDAEEIREALDVDRFIPVRLCDARERESNKQLLITLMEYIMASSRFSATA